MYSYSPNSWVIYKSVSFGDRTDTRDYFSKIQYTLENKFLKNDDTATFSYRYSNSQN